jgi:hypothetical protein
MAWVVARKGPHGTKFKACYRDPSGAERSAGTYLSRRAAERAGQREEQRVREGRWHDYSLGATTFREYVEKTWLPSKHTAASLSQVVRCSVRDRGSCLASRVSNVACRARGNASIGVGGRP